MMLLLRTSRITMMILGLRRSPIGICDLMQSLDPVLIDLLHCLRCELTKQRLSSRLELFHCAEFFTFESPFHTGEPKEVIQTDIRAVGWLGSTSESAKLTAVLVAADWRGVALSKCTISRGDPEARPPRRASESGSSIFAEIAVVELFPGCEPVDQDGAVDPSERSQHCFLGGCRMGHSYRNFISQDAPCLPIIVVPEKPRRVTCHDIT
jgi:hypothetical protein